MSKIINWLSDHRWLLGMNPKGWTDQDEADYLAWAATQPDWRAMYQPKDNTITTKQN